MNLTTYFEQLNTHCEIKPQCKFLNNNAKLARINTNRLSAHNIRSNQLHNFVYRHNEFGVMHFPILKKLWF